MGSVSSFFGEKDDILTYVEELMGKNVRLTFDPLHTESKGNDLTMTYEIIDSSPYFSIQYLSDTEVDGASFLNSSSKLRGSTISGTSSFSTIKIFGPGSSSGVSGAIFKINGKEMKDAMSVRGIFRSFRIQKDVEPETMGLMKICTHVYTTYFKIGEFEYSFIGDEIPFYHKSNDGIRDSRSIRHTRIIDSYDYIKI